MLHLAESIGKHIAQGRVPTWSDLTWLPESGYTYIHTKPYKEIENALGLWQGFLRNFANSSKPIYLISTGNSQEIRLIIGFPNDQINYAESLFFAHFPTSDWLDSKFVMPEHVRFFDFGDSKISSDSDFTKNGLYADPWKDVLSLYESIPQEHQLHIINRVVFNKKKGFIEKLVKNIREVKNIMPEKVDGEKPKEEKKPVEDASATIKFSAGWAVDGPHSLRELVEGKMKAVYTKYLQTGTMKIGNNSQVIKLNINQVINFFHFPTKEFTSTILSVSGYRKLPAPTRIPTLDNVDNKNDLTVLGYTEYKSNNKMFGIKREDKLRHMYIIGMTGTGKSKFIANMVRSDMISNKGVCVMDPHGDLIDDILSQVPSYRTNDVVLFDVSDRDFPVGFNLFECDSEDQKPLIASGIIGIFKKIFGPVSWGPRLEYILRNAVFALLEYPGATFLDLVRMLTDDNYRDEILSHVKDPIILKFWNDEFAKYQPKQREEAVAPITNKVGQFTSSTIVRNIFGQSKTKMRFRQMMDEGKIILINLSKGKIGEDSMSMIGSFIASKIQIDAMSRADIDESQRKDFYLYIDEFQNFATESFASILSEARKYKLSLIVANQYISQIDEPIRNAIFGNVGTLIANRIGKDDAEIMAGQFKGMVAVNDFLSLPNQRCYVKLMIDGMVSDPFSMKTAQFVKYEDFQVIKDKVREQSRQRYAIPRQELEMLMQVWANKKFTMAEKIAEKAAAEGKAWAAQSKAAADGGLPPPAPLVVTPPPAPVKKDFGPIMAMPYPVDSAVTASSLKPLISKKKEEDKPKKSSTKEKVEIENIEKKSNEVSDKIVDETNTINDKKSDVVVDQAPEQAIEDDGSFSIKNIRLGDWYNGYVKLMYNYGIFVTVLGVEGLLHKKNIKELHPDLSWKKIYHIGDPIRVMAESFIEVDGIKRVIWTQMGEDL